jgi:hypothetical protein
MLPDQAQPPPPPASGQHEPVERDPAHPTVASGNTSGGDLWMDLGVLTFTALLVAGVLLLRRWLTLRSRQPHPSLPRERLLPLSRHDTLHDPKYLGRILEEEEPPKGA